MTPSLRFHGVIAGGGAAGFFAAITAAEAGAQVAILEKSSHILSKVRISGGGRCNVTHDCPLARDLVTRYPRGGRALMGLFSRFGPAETIEWFARRGVRLHTESDGRLFPSTNRSETVIECLQSAARAAGVRLFTDHRVDRLHRAEENTWTVETNRGVFSARSVLLATGGCRMEGHPATSCGHRLNPPVPSLFTFHIEAPWVRGLSGLTVADAGLTVAGVSLRERGPLLFTHQGISGPVVLRLSAWGARSLHAQNYHFPLEINWLPESHPQASLEEFLAKRHSAGGKSMRNDRPAVLPQRLWECLLDLAGIPPDTRWARLSRPEAQRLAQACHCTALQVQGKSMNKEEFVTCGGIPLDEVDLKTMQSRIAPGLFFAGEALDIDGLTGGFNFQAAWSTGWHAGTAIAERQKSQ